jgi:hypothetical protein
MNTHVRVPHRPILHVGSWGYLFLSGCRILVF